MRRVSLIYVNGHEIVMVWFHAVSDAAPDCTGSMFRSGDQKKSKPKAAMENCSVGFKDHELRSDNQLHRSRDCDSAGGTRDSYANRQRTRLTAVTGTPIIPLFDTISMPMPPTLAQICIMLGRPQLILGRAPIFIAPGGKRDLHRSIDD